MKGVRSTKDRADRRPSYPSDQWVKKIHATTRVWVKVAMAIGYLICISVVPLCLVVFYVCFWTPDHVANATVPEQNNSCPNATPH